METAQHLHDEQNPYYLYSTTYRNLLLQIASGEIDAKALAIEELRSRGLDPETGHWVGFKKKH